MEKVALSPDYYKEEVAKLPRKISLLPVYEEVNPSPEVGMRVQYDNWGEKEAIYVLRDGEYKEVETLMTQVSSRLQFSETFAYNPLPRGKRKPVGTYTYGKVVPETTKKAGYKKNKIVIKKNTVTGTGDILRERISMKKMKKIKIISMILILCMLCSACGWTSEEVAPIHTENTEINKLSPYLSITRSFYSEESESGMGSRCFFYDIKEKKLEQKGTVSYTSSHPLTLYSTRNDKIYYSAFSGEGKGNQIYLDNNETGEKKTDQFCDFNYLI